MAEHVQVTQQARSHSRAKLSLVVGFVVLLAGVLATVLPRDTADGPPPAGSEETILAGRLHLPSRGGMVRIPAGNFIEGAGDPPRRLVQVRSFWLDETSVTNGAFREFVDATDYTTTAEVRGESLVFDAEAGRWLRVNGADWRHPAGPESSIAGREDWPVVQVSWYDARSYARWVKKRLPTEAEYEYAARGGLADCDYPWGRELLSGGRHHANAWQGWFPDFDQGRDGYLATSPVQAFPANRYGLHDMLGNVYCWCADTYAADEARKVQRGGSWLSAANHDPLTLGRRRGADPAESTNHVGFRCASDLPPDAEVSFDLARRPTGPIE